MPRRRCCCSPILGCCLDRSIRVDFSLAGFPFSGVIPLDCIAALLFGNTYDWQFGLSDPSALLGHQTCYYGASEGLSDPPIETPFACADGISIAGVFMRFFHRWEAIPGPGPTPGVVVGTPQIWVEFTGPTGLYYGTIIFRRSTAGFGGPGLGESVASTTQMLESQYCVDAALMTAALTEIFTDLELDFSESFGLGGFTGFLTDSIWLSVP